MAKIREYDYKIKFIDPFDDKLTVANKIDTYHFGMCSWKTQTIYIAKGLNKEMTKRVIIHEITHAIMEAYGFHAHADSFDKEDICEFIVVYGEEIIRLHKELMLEVKQNGTIR